MGHAAISIHAPLAGSDPARAWKPVGQHISIHAPLAGSDRRGTGWCWGTSDFNPRSPCGERLAAVKMAADFDQFQSTLPLRGATLNGRSGRGPTAYFNPRSPCGERPVIGVGGAEDLHISIHAPLAGSDEASPRRTSRTSNFNPRSPCGERQAGMSNYISEIIFQSTLPLRGATLFATPAVIAALFQSTLPLRGATDGLRWRSERTHFNPRSPCGERR